MRDPLQTYLNDHLAGSAFALDLLALMRERHEDEGLRAFAREIEEEVRADQAVLRALAERIGDGRKNHLKEGIARITEKSHV